MSKFIAVAIKERKVTFLLSFFVIIYGIYAYYYLPRQENPDTSSPAVQIVTVYPGASAKDVEQQVTTKIEDEVAALDGVDWLESFSQDNVSIVLALLENGTDYDEQWDKLRIGIDNLATELPDGVEEPVIDTEMTVSSGLIIAMSSSEYDAGQLAVYADRVKSKIAEIDGVKRVKINGEKERRITIKIDEKALYSLNISIVDVYNIIRAQNAVIPPGAIVTENGKINLQVPQQLRNINDFEDIIVSGSPNNGSVVRLKDIADISFDYDEGTLYYTKDGRSAILITGIFKDDENVVLIGNDVRAVIEDIRATLPEGILFDEVLFQPEDVKVSVNEFIMNLLVGVIFVVFVILIGMGLRNALVVSVAIPLSIAITMTCMQFFKVELQRVSIAALIISLGMLVDNAIVISDAIQVKINAGITNVKAAFLGAKEQAIPVFSSTITTIAAFTPLASLPGPAGEFVSSLPFVVIIALSASYGVAMLVTPALASVLLKPTDGKRDVLKPISKIYTAILKFNLRKPLFTMLILILAVVGAVYLFFNAIDVRMFPYVDKDVIYVTIKNEITGDIDDTHRLVLQAEQLLKEQPEIYDMTLSTGGGLPRFYMTANIVQPSDKNAQIYLKFDLTKGKRFKTREAFLYYIQQLFDSQFVGGDATANLLEINMPGATIDAQIYGRSNDDIVAAGEEIYDYLLDRPETMNVQIVKPEYKYQYQLDVDDEKAVHHGLSAFDIQYQINMALNGAKASVLNVAGKSYDIYIESDISTIDDIKNLKIKSQFTDQKILVKQIADVKLKSEISEIRRFDRKPVVMVKSYVRPQYGSGSVQRNLEKYIADRHFDNVEITYGGDSDAIRRYLSGLGSAAVLAVIAIYIILLIQFNSFVQPFVIMMTLPLALLGVIFGLLISQTNFTFTVGLGAASLIGIVVNNGILLIEYINRARASGMTVHDACLDSAGKRMRPILLSTVTTIFGLIPLVFADSSFFTPMAIALIGGLLIATVMTVTVIPTVYSLLIKLEKPKIKLDLDL